MHPLSAALARRLAVSCEVAAAVILAVVSAINLAQVLGRYFFASSFPWAEEVMRYVMMWLMMLGGTACIYRCEHMAIDAVRNWLPERQRAWYRNLLFGIAGVFCLLLVWYGWPAALANASQFAAASRLPMIVPYLAIPVGGVLMLVQIVLCWRGGYQPVGLEEQDAF